MACNVHLLRWLGLALPSDNIPWPCSILPKLFWLSFNCCAYVIFAYHEFWVSRTSERDSQILLVTGSLNFLVHNVLVFFGTWWLVHFNSSALWRSIQDMEEHITISAQDVIRCRRSANVGLIAVLLTVSSFYRLLPILIISLT